MCISLLCEEANIPLQTQNPLTNPEHTRDCCHLHTSGSQSLYPAPDPKRDRHRVGPGLKLKTTFSISLEVPQSHSSSVLCNGEGKKEQSEVLTNWINFNNLKWPWSFGICYPTMRELRQRTAERSIWKNRFYFMFGTPLNWGPSINYLIVT